MADSKQTKPDVKSATPESPPKAQPPVQGPAGVSGTPGFQGPPGPKSPAPPTAALPMDQQVEARRRQLLTVGVAPEHVAEIERRGINLGGLIALISKYGPQILEAIPALLALFSHQAADPLTAQQHEDFKRRFAAIPDSEDVVADAEKRGLNLGAVWALISKYGPVVFQLWGELVALFGPSTPPAPVPVVPSPSAPGMEPVGRTPRPPAV